MYYSCTIGTFDGIHKGHQYILNETKKFSEKNTLKPLAIILKYPIKKYFNSFDGLILPSYLRKQIIEGLGFEVEIIEMKDVWHISHEDYLQMLYKKGVRAITCGEDFRFGKGAKGDIYSLQYYTNKSDLKLNLLHDLKERGKRISSTDIRKCLKQGDVKTVNEKLYQRWSLEGLVYEDRKTGKKLGFPTANIDIRYKEEIIYPKYGVYLVKGYIDDKNNQSLWALMSVGVRPTYFENLKTPKVEIHFFDFNEILYSKFVKVEIYDYLREEKKFDTSEELINAMKKDKENALKIIK